MPILDRKKLKVVKAKQNDNNTLTLPKIINQVKPLNEILHFHFKPPNCKIIIKIAEFRLYLLFEFIL